jgi:hypothetical protein
VLLSQYAMTGAAICYAFGCIGYFLEGRHWMAATLALYALTVGTLYMAGDK